MCYLSSLLCPADCSCFVADDVAQSALHSIEVDDLDRNAAALRRFLRVRERDVESEQSDSGVDDAMEPALAGGRDVKR